MAPGLGAGIPLLEEDSGPRVTPVTASVTQLEGMVPRPGFPVSIEQKDEAIARAATRKR